MSPRHSNIPSLRIQTMVRNETFEDAKYFEWYNPVIQKYLNGELTDHELVNEIFEPFEQVSQIQAQLLGLHLRCSQVARHKLMLELAEVAHHLICLGARRRMITTHQEGGNNYGSINKIMFSPFCDQG